MSDETAFIKSLFDPESFAQSLDAAGEELKKYFENAGEKPRVRQWVDPRELFLKASHELQHKKEGGLEKDRVGALAKMILDNSHNLHSPRYMGHQVPPPLPLAGIFDFIGAAANQAPGIYEMGPWSMVAEKVVITEMAKLIGWENTNYGAIGTSGGSLANLTAILAARNHRYKDVWTQGLAQSQRNTNLKAAIVVGADSHYSVMRSAGVLGLGTDQIIKSPLDSKRRMDPAQLRIILEQTRKDGLDVFCVVANACSTPTGAFDPIKEIAEILKERNIWLHVDGAHGASVLFSKTHRDLVSGIDQADSITWDAHKMMYVPALSTFVFYKNKETRDGAFRQEAPYLNDPTAARAAEYDTFGGTLECTKRPLALGVWAVLALYGPSVFETLIDQTFKTTLEFYKLIKESKDFEVLHEPQSNILCFRYLPTHIKNENPAQIGEFQKVWREKIVKAGEYYITATKIDEAYCLRVTLINPMTNLNHLKGLLEHIRGLP